MKQKHEEGKESKYIAVYNESATTGVGIIDFGYGVDDYCITESFSSNDKKRTKNKIYTNDKDGRSYIIKSGKKIYMDQFIKL